MRALETSDVKEKRARKMQIIVGVFLVLIMVGSTAGFAYYLKQDNSSQQQTGDYFDGKYWIIQRDSGIFYLYSSLEDIQSVQVEGIKPGDFIGQSFYIDAPQAVSQQILLNLQGYFAKLQPACYGSCEVDLPEKDCTQPIIVYKAEGDNKIYKQDSCIFIQGDSRSIDAFIVRLAGI